jgi:hypothetical protein
MWNRINKFKTKQTGRISEYCIRTFIGSVKFVKNYSRTFLSEPSMGHTSQHLPC